MKRFQFPLEGLLRLRRQKDRQAEARQQTARLACEAAQREVDTLMEHLVASASAVEARIGQSLATERWVAQYQHISQVRIAVDQAELKACRARNILEEANRQRRLTALELQALEKLRVLKWQEHRRESARLEQHRLDDAFLYRNDNIEQSVSADTRQIGGHGS